MSLDAKDIYIAQNYINKELSTKGYNIRHANGDINTRRFINTLDYSLDLITLREVYESVYRRTDLTFEFDSKAYTTRVINVTFEYSNKEYNKIRGDLYVKNGYAISEVVLSDSVWVVDGELRAIQIGVPVEHPCDCDILGKYFTFEGGVYCAKTNIGTVVGVDELREHLYANGFICDGIKYVRWKRSGGSSRVGKCLFIDEKLYAKMHRWEVCGIKVKKNQQIDLAAFESYISLPSSSILDTIEINPENILVIDDYDSVFFDDVICVEEKNGKLIASEKTIEIKNSIWDGQTIIDESLMGKYADKSMILLRNLFFKSCCFKGKLQKWFADNGIERVDQLNGFTLAQKIEDVKFVTTPNSIKYLKFGSLDDWLKNIDPMFGVVKYNKPTHFFDGRMVQTHYQLLNTLELTYGEVERLLKPTLEYINLLQKDPSVLRYHIKYPENSDFFISPAVSKNDIVYKLLGINKEFAKTKLYADFRSDLLKSFVKNVKYGHILVDGNYSTLFGNPIEMLLSAIGRFDGRSTLGIGNIHNRRFEFGKHVVGSRSPHVTMGNVWLPLNVDNYLIREYFDLADEIVCINSIGENTLQRLSGADFDSDTVLLTDNQILIDAARRNYDKFKVPTSAVVAKKTVRKYNSAEQADLDIKTSKNLIGEIINMSQELNSEFWDRVHKGESIDDLKDLYYDIAKLDVMSGIEIDKAKKEFIVDTAKELKYIRQKYKKVRKKDGKQIKPHFFGHIAKQKGYYNNKKKAYMPHDTTMDYVQTCVNKHRYASRNPYKHDYAPFSVIINQDLFDANKVKYEQVKRIVSLIENTRDEVKIIYSLDDMDMATKYMLASEANQRCVEYIGNIKLSDSTMIYLLRLIENPEYKSISRTIMNTLFGHPNLSFFRVLKNSKEKLPVLKEQIGGNIQLYSFNFVQNIQK